MGDLKAGQWIGDAKWFTKDNLPQLPKLATISGIMINHWLKNR